jgi:hypothetical protein
MMKLEIGQMVWVWNPGDAFPRSGIVMQIIEKDKTYAMRGWQFDERDYVLLIEGRMERIQDYRCFPSYEELRDYEFKAHARKIGTR